MNGLHPAALLARALGDLAGVVASLSPAAYAAPAPGFPSSVGGQVRHCLDHVAALVTGAASGRIDYDRRVRGTPVETSPPAALAAIDRLAAGLVALAAADLDRDVVVVERLAPADPPVGNRSSLGRELAFVLSHTHHHGALIAPMARAVGGTIPERFGFAPSTLAHLAAVERERRGPAPPPAA